MEKVEPVLGIDLGTTYSCVATWKADNIVICPNNNGDRITPSIVFENEKEILIGDKAKYFTQSMNKLMTNSKRLIGLLYNDETIKKDFKYFNTEIIKDKKTFKPKYKIIMNDKEKTYFPEDVSSMILNHLRKFSEDFIGEKVKKAVITVPAHFNNEQREATKKAAENAGLEVIRIINEARIPVKSSPPK